VTSEGFGGTPEAGAVDGSAAASKAVQMRDESAAKRTAGCHIFFILVGEAQPYAGTMEHRMTGWQLSKEPTLDDLLADEMMTAVMRSAGVDAKKLKGWLADMARRRSVAPGERRVVACCC
jgi:hypothetical protein